MELKLNGSDSSTWQAKQFSQPQRYKKQVINQLIYKINTKNLKNNLFNNINRFNTIEMIV
jgi:hypothetical protein